MNNKHPYLLAFGENIRRLRQKRGLSQEAFAAEVGLDRSYMGGIERGERNIAVVNIIKIAKALNVEVGQLFPKISAFKD